MPKVLLLWTDQQRFDSLACYGNRMGVMPHCDRLAESCTVFERAYCSSPVCTPSRGSVMTGLYPHAHGALRNNVPLRADCPTLAEHLREGGSFGTGYVGKWHLGDEIFPQHGFDAWQAVEDDYQAFFSEGRDRDARSPYHHWLVARGYRPPAANHFPRDWCCMLPERDSKPAFCAERAIDFIRQQAGGDWLLSVNTLEPHHPLPGARNSEIDPVALETAPDFCVETDDVPLRVRMQRATHRHQGFEHFHLRDQVSWRQALAHYWGLCRLVDDQFARILAALEESGQFDDTLIVVTSDHGEMCGGHGLFGKGVPYECSNRIPLLVKLPGQRQQRRVAQPVSLVDLCPTIVDCCQDRVPEGLHGRSLRPLLEGGEQEPRDVLLVWTGSGPDLKLAEDPPAHLRGLAEPDRLARAAGCHWRGLVTPEGFKLAVTDLGEWELYDLHGDPWELQNLAPRPEHHARLSELRGRLQAAMEQVGDSGMAVPEL